MEFNLVQHVTRRYLKLMPPSSDERALGDADE